MLKLEILDDGIDNILRDIKEDLYSVVGKSKSKKEKDDMIYKTIGAIRTLYYTIAVREVDDGASTEEKT